MEDPTQYDYFQNHVDNDSLFLNFTFPSIDHCKGHNKPDVLFAGFAIFIVAVGLVGNLLVFSTIAILREYKNSITNWYILQLTIADSLFLAMLPFSAHSELIGIWDFSLALCKFKEAVLFINYYSSIYFLVVMSFDRYLAVNEALDSNRWTSNLRKPVASYLITALGWAISILLCIQLYSYSTISKCQVCSYTFPEDNMANLSSSTDLAASTSAMQKLKRLQFRISEYKRFKAASSFTLKMISLSLPIFRLGIQHSDLEDKSTADVNEQIFPDQYVDFNYDDYTEKEKRLRNDIYRMVFDHIKEESKLPSDTVLCKLPDSYTLKVWIYGNFIGAFCVPFILICVFYGIIMKTISSASRIGAASIQRSYKRRVTMIVLALVALFAISWLPWYVDKIVRIKGIQLTEDACKTLSSSVRGLAYLNSALNPYFYGFLGTHFRDRLQRVYCRIIRTTFKSKLPETASTKDRRRRTSLNNVGVIKCLNKQRNRSSAYGNYVRDVRRSSLSMKTERTIV